MWQLKKLLLFCSTPSVYSVVLSIMLLFKHSRYICVDRMFYQKYNSISFSTSQGPQGPPGSIGSVGGVGEKVRACWLKQPEKQSFDNCWAHFTCCCHKFGGKWCTYILKFSIIFFRNLHRLKLNADAVCFVLTPVAMNAAHRLFPVSVLCWSHRDLLS